MFFGDIGDEFLDDDGLAYAGTTEDTCLTTAGERGNQVDDFDTRFKDLRLGGLLFEQWGALVDGALLTDVERFVKTVDGFTDDVEDASERRRTDGH